VKDKNERARTLHDLSERQAKAPKIDVKIFFVTAFLFALLLFDGTKNQSSEKKSREISNPR